MSCHSGPELASGSGTSVVLVGNHNVGKSVIFGWLTGRYVTVANYPGSTVEVARGKTRSGKQWEVVDTPGIHSLRPGTSDEAVTRDILLSEQPHLIVQVADAKNLRRALLITSQLAETEQPLVLALNMMDEARAQQIAVDVPQLTEKIGVPVIPMAATRGEGLGALASALEGTAPPARPLVHFPEPVEDAVHRLSPLLAGIHPAPRALALMLLSGDSGIDAWVRARTDSARWAEIVRLRRSLDSSAETPMATLVQQARTQWIDETVRAIYGRKPPRQETRAAALGRLATHPIWGIPILLGVLTLMYLFVGSFGAGTLVGFIEGTVFGEWINPALSALVLALPLPGIVQDFLVGEYGVLTVALTYGFAIILPIVATFFIAFGLLEDSGYLPRLTVIANRLFKTMGLNGKAVLPMVLGLGCDTMATITTRTLETTKDRVLVTLLLALGVPCSAQLGVVLGMLAGLEARATLIWLGAVCGVLISVGWLASRVIPGAPSDFIVELPPMRVPRLSHLFVKTLARIEWYLKEVIPLFVVGTAMLFVLDRIGALDALKLAAQPLIVQWLGLPPEATEAFLIGFLRRDYGAAGFFLMARDGLLTPNQIVVGLVTITLFVPCIANVLVMVRERGAKTALAITAFVFPFAFLVGGALNLALRLWN